MSGIDIAFEKSSGQPTQYKDSVVRLSDFIPVEDKDEFLLTFERFGSEWIQGVSLGLLDNKGSITISGHAFDKGCGIWQDRGLKPNGTKTYAKEYPLYPVPS